MATAKSKKTQNLTSEKPIRYTTVKEEEEKESLSSILKSAGENANGLISNTAYIMGDEDEPTFMPTNPDDGTSPSIPDGEGSGEKEVLDFEDLFNVFEDIDKKFENITDKDYFPLDAFSNAIPDEIEVEKYDVPEIDEEKLRAEITESETSKNEIEKNNLQNQTEKKTEKIYDTIESMKTASEKEKQEIQEIYDNYKVNVENDAIKRGLARSSVAILSMDNLESSRAKELSRVAENLTTSIVNAEKEISSLQKDLEISLDNLDLELAENINKELKKRIDELEEERKEAIKFNNSVEEMQADYKRKIADSKNTQSAIEAKLLEEYKGAAETDKREQKLDVAMKYFNTMDKTSALKIIINSPELARVLGEDYYTLYYYVMRR